MFGKKEPGEGEEKKVRVEKLPGPKEIPAFVGKYLVDQKKRGPDWVRKFKAVVRRNPKGEKTFDIRIFDENQAAVKKVTVKDYTSLDERPELVIYEGWFDEKSRQVELEEKPGLEFSLKVSQDVPIFTEAEIRQKIEELSAPGSTVFFYLAGSPAYGGPLGRGAAIVELNPDYPGKKQKKYILHVTDVDGMEPVGKGQKMFDADEAKKIASYIKEAHHKPYY